MARAVRWNEENLSENDRTRTATMIIDEPPTPFNFEYCEDEEEEEEEGASQTHIDPKPKEEDKASADGVPKDPKVGLSFAEQWKEAGLEEALEDPANLRPSCIEPTEEEKEAARIEFEKNRKKHYDMRAALQKKDFDDDDDDSNGKAAK